MISDFKRTYLDTNALLRPYLILIEIMKDKHFILDIAAVLVI